MLQLDKRVNHSAILLLSVVAVALDYLYYTPTLASAFFRVLFGLSTLVCILGFRKPMFWVLLLAVIVLDDAARSPAPWVDFFGVSSEIFWEVSLLTWLTVLVPLRLLPSRGNVLVQAPVAVPLLLGSLGALKGLPNALAGFATKYLASAMPYFGFTAGWLVVRDCDSRGDVGWLLARIIEFVSAKSYAYLLLLALGRVEYISPFRRAVFGNSGFNAYVLVGLAALLLSMRFSHRRDSRVLLLRLHGAVMMIVQLVHFAIYAQRLYLVFTLVGLLYALIVAQASRAWGLRRYFTALALGSVLTVVGVSAIMGSSSVLGEFGRLRSDELRWAEILNILHTNARSVGGFLWGQGFGGYFDDEAVPMSSLRLGYSAFPEDQISSGLFFSPHDIGRLLLTNGITGMVIYFTYVGWLLFRFVLRARSSFVRQSLLPYLAYALPALLASFYLTTKVGVWTGIVLAICSSVTLSPTGAEDASSLPEHPVVFCKGAPRLDHSKG